jgi:hypothetical protein
MNRAVRLYRHRVNTVTDLETVPGDMGIELDLRSSGNDVLVTHDPFTDGPTIEEYFPRIGRRPCIFNVKCEGIEARVRDLAQKHGIEDWFMLDLSVPAAVKLARMGETRIAVRYSEMEPKEGVLAWKGRARWVWVDCFTRFPVEEPAWSEIADAFQVCLVSPELQGHAGEAFDVLRSSLAGHRFDAVCTKTPARWSASP